MTNQQKGNLYVLAAAILWSTGGLLLKFVPFTPILTNGLRSLFGFLLFCFYRKRIKIHCNKIIVIAGICLTLTTIFYVAGNKYTTAANAIVLQYTAPLWVLLWNSLYHKQIPRKTDLISMVIAFGGTVLFFFDGLSGEHMFGNILSLMAGLAFSGVLFLNFLPGANSEESSTLGFLINFIICIPFLGQLSTYSSSTVKSAMFVIIILGVFQVGLAYMMFSKGSRLTKPVTASLIDLLEAVLNPTWVFLFYGEKVGRLALLGATCIIAAVAFQIISSQDKKNA